MKYRADVVSFEVLTRALVGITLESLDVLEGRVSVAQFRLLLTLDGLGRVPSTKLAAALKLGPSAVTRGVDRLVRAGLVVRGTDPRSRSIVTVEATPEGSALVARVLEQRATLLANTLDRMTPQQREAAQGVAEEFCRHSDHLPAVGAAGPLPL